MCETLREIFPKLLGERDDGDGNTNAPPLRPDKIHPRGRRGPSGSIGIFSKIGIGQFGRGSNSCGILSPSLGLFYYLQCCRHTLMRSNGSRQESMMVCLCYHYHVESQNVCVSRCCFSYWTSANLASYSWAIRDSNTTRLLATQVCLVWNQECPAHLCSHATAKGDMLFLGPNRVVSGLWSVTRTNLRSFKYWWNFRIPYTSDKVSCSISG